MKKLICLYFVINLIPISLCLDVRDRDLTTPQLISKYGYTPEIHYVTTEDGYILEMHRIVVKKKAVSSAPSSKSKRVVFAQHGLSTSSADFILAGSNESIAFYLADLGYDVWLGNSRGSRYSRNHTTLSTSSSKYWDFSWHEMGVYDLTASIDYVLEATGHKTLSYLGFSQGTTMFFVMCTERPAYQHKINFMQALGPAVYLSRTKNLILRLSNFITNSIEIKLLKLPPHEFPPQLPSFMRSFVVYLCTIPQTRNLCLEILFEAFGYDSKYTDLEVINFFANHFSTGVSNLNVAHYGQLVNEDRFGQFDYGSVINMQKYGQRTPPDYNISAVTVPVMLIYTLNDGITHPDDAFKLRDTLPNVVEFYEPLYKEYNHMDYVLGKGVRQSVYKRMSEVLDKYSRD